jgi:hypothetical protein
MNKLLKQYGVKGFRKLETQQDKDSFAQWLGYKNYAEFQQANPKEEAKKRKLKQ